MALSDQLISWYKLDETTGTTAFDSTGSVNATNSNMSINQTGKIGSCYLADSDNDYLNTNIALNPLLQDTSISLWFTTSTSTSKKFISTDYNNTVPRGFQIYSNDAGGMDIYTGANAYSSSDGLITSGPFYHFVAVLSSGANNSYFYLNGSQILNFNGNYNNTSKTLYLCSRVGAETTTTWLGKIDEVAVWTRALSLEEIQSVFNSGNGLTYPFEATANIYVNVGDDWKTISDSKLQIGDAWKDVSSIKINIGD